MYYFSNLKKKLDKMIFCGSSQYWNERKKVFQARKLSFLITVKESYERKLAAITASISKLEEQMISDTQTEES
tara:strand:+ start:972 stop:1190 length:219 start_codon:yes stop_codon:yes gene_type:complete